ncbi:MAG: protein kinase [Planctomycetota bacterium]|nr:protein kinase [Planctomycetota bacterium]
MAEEEEINLGKLAVERGYCTKAQFDDALYTHQEVNKLGLNERLGNILVKKKVLTEAQIKELLKLQGQKSKIKIAGYEIIEKVGQGGMGAVFKARQVSLDRIVALKILSPKLAADKSFCERFVKEARAVAKLSHPNIIVGIDVGQQDKYFYFAMEFVEGETALRILRDSGPFGEERAIDVALQIAKALDHAHKHGMIHRDIKPDNIMITPRSEAKLCDLGLAKMTEGDPSQSRGNVAVGTPHYIAPEQARGESGIGITADIYALGASLYHMTCGATLFQGKSSRDIMAQHLTDEAPNVRKLRPEISEPFSRLLEKMLAKNPKDRHAAPADLIEDLERVRDRKPIKAPLNPIAKTSMEKAPKAARGITTGPRSPVERSTTGPRMPVNGAEIGTGPKKATSARGQPLLIAAVVVVLGLGVGIGLAISGGGQKPPATPSTRETAKKDPPPETVATPVAAKKDPEPEAKRPDPEPEAPPAKSGWEPLDKAREARRGKPKDFAEVLGLYDAAEKGAPTEMIATIRREKSEVERAQFQEFQVYLKNRTREAERKVEQKNYAAALGMFVDGDFPAAVMTDFSKAELAKVRAEFENRIMEVFNKNERQEIVKDVKNAANDLGKLHQVKEKNKELLKTYTFKAAQDVINANDQRLDQMIKQLSSANDRQADQAYQQAVDLAVKEVREDDMAGARKRIDEAAGNRVLMGKYGAQIQTFKEDLAAIESLYKKAGEALESKAGSNEQIEVTAGGAKVAGTVVAKGGNEKDGPGVIVKDASGQPHNVSFSKLEVGDVIRLAGVKGDAPGRYLHGAMRFWNMHHRSAFEMLKNQKGPKELGVKADYYTDLIEAKAGQLIESVHQIGRELHDGKLPPDKENERRQTMQKIVEHLNKDYSQTEAYRARTKP